MRDHRNHYRHIAQAKNCLQKAQSYMGKMELDPACFGPAKKAELEKAYKHFKKAEHFARLIRASLEPESYEARSKWENIIEKVEHAAFEIKENMKFYGSEV